jgi:hypothetical protein
VDADAETHLHTGRSIGILFGYGVLNLHGALHGVHGTGEISDEAIARRVEDPASVRGNEPIDDDPVGRQGAESANLILPMRRL